MEKNQLVDSGTGPDPSKQQECTQTWNQTGNPTPLWDDTQLTEPHVPGQLKETFKIFHLN